MKQMGDESSALPAWPEDLAKHVKLLVPKGLRTKRDYCSLRYNEKSRILMIVDGREIILDAIDIEDLIGAKLEVHVNGGKAESKTAIEHKDDNHPASNTPSSDALEDGQGSATLTLFTYPRKNPSDRSYLQFLRGKSWDPRPHPRYRRPRNFSRFGDRFAYPRRLTVAPSEDLQAITTITAILQQYATGRGPEKSLRYLVMANPFSGPKKNGKKVAENLVRNMLAESGVECDVLVTTHAGHATERAQKQDKDDEDITAYDAIVVVGGDGILNEVLNGIMSRTDDHEQVLHKLKFGIVGCGSANGMAATICFESKERCGPINDMYLICKGRSARADLSRYLTSTGKTYLSGLTFAWGMVADIDIDSEVIRRLGESRFDLWGAHQVVIMTKYRGRLSYTAEPIQPNELPPLSEPVPSDWKVIEDDIHIFWASHVSHAAMHSFSSPFSKLQDGVFQILLVRGKVSRYRIASVFLGFGNGSHAHMHGVEFIACTAYRLEPLEPGSHNDLDGEVIEDGPVQAYVLPASWEVFCNLEN